MAAPPPLALVPLPLQSKEALVLQNSASSHWEGVRHDLLVAASARVDKPKGGRSEALLDQMLGVVPTKLANFGAEATVLGLHETHFPCSERGAEHSQWLRPVPPRCLR